MNIDRAILLKGNLQNAYVALGSYFKFIEDYKNAELNYKKAIEIKGKDVSLHLAMLYLDLDNIEESLKILNKLLKSKPIAKNYFYRGLIYNNAQQFALALQDLKKAFELNNNFYKSSFEVCMLLCAKIKFCDWFEFKKLKNFILNLTQVKNLKNLEPFGLFSFVSNPELIKKVTEAKFNDLSLSITSNKIFNIKKNRKIKIGYYSPDFYEHPVGYIFSELITYHDKSRFELIGFDLNPKNKILKTKSTIKNEIINKLDNYINCDNYNYLELVEKSKNLEIDLAVDLAGYTAHNKMKSFIKKLAPIQINFLGYPGTLGASHDYIIADLKVIPKKMQDFYFEKIIYMPDTYLPSFTKFDFSLNLTKESLGLKENQFIFASFNNHAKINPIIFDSWMRILKKVKNSVLIFNDGDENLKKNLRIEANNRGIAIDRIIFIKYLDYSSHAIKYKLCDLVLDTFPFTGHSTASTCLLSGCPLITIESDSFHTNVGSSLLSSLNLSELICNNFEEYENKAINIANSQNELRRIKDKLKDSLINSKTFNTKNYTKNLEKAYNKIYERYHHKLEPENIFIK